MNKSTKCVLIISEIIDCSSIISGSCHKHTRFTNNCLNWFLEYQLPFSTSKQTFFKVLYGTFVLQNKDSSSVLVATPKGFLLSLSLTLHLLLFRFMTLLKCTLRVQLNNIYCKFVSKLNKCIHK